MSDVFAPAVNLYGDRDIRAGDGRHGIDVAAQRADDLDLAAVERIRTLVAAGHAPVALDLGCASGAQMARMAAAGAHVVGVDLANTWTDVRANVLPYDPRPLFIAGDIRRLDRLPMKTWIGNRSYDVIVCQRTIHYMTWMEALEVLRGLSRRLLAPDGMVFLSASGLSSELSEGYAHADRPVHGRSAPLSEVMRQKHGIHGSVTLYGLDDLEDLCRTADLCIEKSWVSPFGNVKVVAAMR